ncbi:MAG: oxidoreductase [Planctomycetes bacterium RBG_16_64_10]|nr:MAG: oxidoreductase [Planctomycetes bacterium RBG_16_64_10]
MPIRRRSFLGQVAAGCLAGPLVARGPLRAASPNGRLQHAAIGVGGMGAVDLDNLRQHPRVTVVALCDVDAQRLKAAADKVPGARLYRDWRELLETEGDKVDSVNVSVPDHMHFPIACSAIERGKHTYLQKPMCHDVAEVRRLTEAATRQGVMTQLGTQLASGAGDRTTVQYLRDGVIGEVRHVYISANRPGAVENYRPLGPRPAVGQPPPPNLDWDLWLGTAPERPFVPDLYHPVKWRGWLDFGTGWSGDIGCHLFDAVWKGLRLTAPTSVTARVEQSWQDSPARRADTWPRANHITWRFPGNDASGGEEMTIEWFDGEFWAPEEIRALYSVDQYPTESAMVIGTRGALLNPPGSTPHLLPAAKFTHIQPPTFDDRNHYHHFVDACLGGPRCECHFAQTGPMTEAILLGTVAVRLPETNLEWDHTALEVRQNPAANELLCRTYRAGWHVGGL